MASGTIEKYFADRKGAIERLLTDGEVSFANSLQDDFRKTLLLSCASFFEARITEDFMKLAVATAGERSILTNLLKNKALKRQYHTLFDWEKKNANAFFGMLGEDFSAYAKKAVIDDNILEKGIADFLELGSLRNQLVHRNFVSFPLEKTPDEIFSQYRSGLTFVNWLSASLSAPLEINN